MRILRSIFCAGLAMIAISLCASIPAAAAIDPVSVVQPMTGKDYPAPVPMIIHQDVAVLPDETGIPASVAARSSIAASASSVARPAFTMPAYLHIDPGRTRI